jgi:hypothetical protein
MKKIKDLEGASGLVLLEQAIGDEEIPIAIKGIFLAH